jgi:hypothetical protein
MSAHRPSDKTKDAPPCQTKAADLVGKKNPLPTQEKTPHTAPAPDSKEKTPSPTPPLEKPPLGKCDFPTAPQAAPPRPWPAEAQRRSLSSVVSSQAQKLSKRFVLEKQNGRSKRPFC